MAERAQYRDGYEVIGSQMTDVRISLDTAYQARGNLLSAFLEPLDYVTRVESVERDAGTCLNYKLFTGKGVKSIPMSDFIFDKTYFTGGYIRQFADNAWRMGVMHNKMWRSTDDFSENKIRSFFRIIVWNDQLVEASRTVKFHIPVRRGAPLGPQSNEMLATKQSRRVGYTVPLHEEDCIKLQTILERYVRRVAV